MALGQRRSTLFCRTYQSLHSQNKIQFSLDMCSIDKSSIKDNKIADAEVVRETIPKLEFDSRIFQPTWALILRLLGTTAPTTVLEVVAVVVGLRLGLDRPRLTGDAAGADEGQGR